MKPVKVFHGRRQTRIHACTRTYVYAHTLSHHACTYTSFRASRTRRLAPLEMIARGGAPRTGPLSSLSGERRTGRPIRPSWSRWTGRKGRGARASHVLPVARLSRDRARPGSSGTFPILAQYSRGELLKNATGKRSESCSPGRRYSRANDDRRSHNDLVTDVTFSHV